MSDKDNTLQRMVVQKYFNNPAAFTVQFTNIWEDSDGTRQEPYPKQLLFLNAQNLPSIMTVLKCRQCLSGDSVVYTENGPMQMKNMLGYRGKVWTLDENGNQELDNVIDSWEVGTREVFEVKLASGERIVGTEKHKINTESGWKTIGELKVGDLVKTFEGKFGNEKPSDDEVKVMAYFITDGSYTNASPKFTNINRLYLDEFNESVKSEWNVDTRWQPKGKGFDLCVLGKEGWGANKPNEFAKFLMSHDMRDKKGADRVLPKKYLEMDKEKTALLLNRMFAADGWYSSSHKSSLEVGIASMSLEYLYQVSYLLSKFNIHCRILEEKNGKKQKSKFYKLRFASHEYTQKFLNEIGIFGKEPQKDFKPTHKSHKEKNRVISIKEFGEEVVYDLTTKKHHSYIANGIHVHNSGFSSAAVAKIVHNAYFAMSPEIMIMSRTQKQATKVLRRIRSAFNSMPEFMRPKFLKETEEQLILANGTVIYSLPANPEGARGFTGDVYLDEFGTFGNRESFEIWTAIAPATTKGYRIYVIGTPQGTENLFYDLSTKSLEEFSGVKGVQDSFRMSVHWSEVPHIAKDILNIRSRFTPLMFEQEYELKFLEDADDLFFTSQFLLEHFVDKREEDDLIKFKLYNPLVFKENGGFKYDEKNVPEEVKMKELYEKYSEVIIGWDLAKQQDSSVVTVLGKVKDSERYELIGIEFLDKLDYTIQAKYVSIIAQLTMAKKMGFDNTGLGGAVADIIKETKIGGIAHPVNFTKQFKMEAYQNMRSMIYQGDLKIPKHDRIIGEFKSLMFDPVAQKIEAMPGADEYGNTHKDDIPCSFIIAIDAIRKKKSNSGFSFMFG